jgi:hypothetical protein
MSAPTNARLWESSTPRRYFLVPRDVDVPAGSLVLRTRLGEETSVDPGAIVSYEVSEDQAHRWASAELGVTLTDLRASLDDTLAEMRARLDDERRAPVAPDANLTPNAIPALLDLMRALPGIVGQGISGDEERVAAARLKLAELQRRLGEGGVDLDERFTGFADRLAGLRHDFQARRSSQPNDGSQDTEDSSGDTSGRPDPGSSP